TSAADGIYQTGAVIDITVSFSQAVTVDTSGGTPRLALNSGGFANYVSGTGTTTLVFRYTVGAGESSSDLDYTSPTALSANGGAINAKLTLAAPGASGSLSQGHAVIIGASGTPLVKPVGNEFRVNE